MVVAIFWTDHLFSPLGTTVKQLGFARLAGRFRFRSFAALIPKLAAVEAHGSMLDCRTPLLSEYA
jgi:hypothetical protein